MMLMSLRGFPRNSAARRDTSAGIELIAHFNKERGGRGRGGEERRGKERRGEARRGDERREARRGEAAAPRWMKGLQRCHPGGGTGLTRVVDPMETIAPDPVFLRQLPWDGIGVSSRGETHVEGRVKDCHLQGQRGGKQGMEVDFERPGSCLTAVERPRERRRERGLRRQGWRGRNRE